MLAGCHGLPGRFVLALAVDGEPEQRRHEGAAVSATTR